MKTPLVYQPYDPSPPGDTLAEWLEMTETSQAELARRTNLTTKHINQVIKGGVGISPEVAVAFERVTEIPARFWAELDANFQTARYVTHEAQSFERDDLDLVDVFPVKHLTARGQLPKVDSLSKVERLKVLLRFFAVANPRALRSVWLQPTLYRLEQSASNQQGSIAAWLRIAELEATKMTVAKFDAAACRNAIPAMRKLCELSGDTWIQPLKQLCADVGIALVVVKELPKCGINGATRWLSPDRAMIALSGRRKRSDIVWFTFFHELGHVLRHSKKETFVDHDHGAIAQNLEDEADSFAARTLIPSKYTIALHDIRTSDDLDRLSHDVGVHPTIIIGRMLHTKQIPYKHRWTRKLERFEYADA